jgi:hypothetical protein
VTYSGNVTGQIEGVRQQTVAVLDELISKTGEFELADPPPALERYRGKLRENAYKVLVVWEAKRGKSTFVNALIGQDILPTDVDVATSQVFNIRPSQREAYRVRFEDGSVREILSEDLPHHGSRIVPDAGVVPAPQEIIRRIEVKDARVEVKKGDSAIVPLGKCLDGISVLKGAGESDCALNSQKANTSGKNLLGATSLLTPQNFRENFLRSVSLSPISGYGYSGHK